MIEIDPYHCFAENRLWCVACRKSMYQIANENLPCCANRMFCAVLDLGGR